MSPSYNIGDIVTYRGVRGQIRLLYADAPFVAVVTFPQDVGWVSSKMYEDWPVTDIRKTDG